MAAHGSTKQDGPLVTGLSILLASALVLPGFAPALFGWISGLLAIPVFGLLYLHGSGRGTVLIRNAILLAVAVAVLTKDVPSLLFSLTLVPLGYSFSLSAAAGENEWKTGVRGCLTLALVWLIFWSAYGAIKGMNPYTHLAGLLDTGFAQTYDYYRVKADMPAETLLHLEQAVNELRALVPKLLPGILCCTVILTVWINLTAGFSLVERLRPGQLPWKPYSQWRLPDWIVWCAIGSGTALLFGGSMITEAALTLVLICGLLYFFQGLAVFIHLLDRWKVPLYLRFAIYGFLILQSYGLLMLAVLGLADVWLDVRNRPGPPTESMTD